MRRRLKMQPAHGSGLMRQGMIVLHEIKINARRQGALPVPAFAEKPPAVGKAGGRQDQQALQRGLFDVHGPISL